MEEYSDRSSLPKIFPRQTPWEETDIVAFPVTFDIGRSDNNIYSIPSHHGSYQKFKDTLKPYRPKRSTLHERAVKQHTLTKEGGRPRAWELFASK